MRFCKQRDQYSGGAIALLNVDKFFGHHVTYQNLPRYRKLVNCAHPHGTHIQNITKVLGQASRRKWTKAKQFLWERNCILIFVSWKSSSHYYLMVMEDYDIQVVNRFGSSGFKVSSWYASKLLEMAKRTWYVSEGIL